GVPGLGLAGLLAGGVALGGVPGGSGQVLADAGGLAFQTTQVIELGATDLATTLDLDRFDGRAVALEHALDAGAVRDLAHGEGGVQAAVALGDDHALVGLDALAVAFLHLDVD